MGSSPVYKLEEDGHDYESGYASGSSSNAELPEIYFTKPHLAFLNRQFQNLEPQGTKFASLLIHGQADIQYRNIAMVSHLITRLIPRNRIRLHWPNEPRHAFKNEDPKTANG